MLPMRKFCLALSMGILLSACNDGDRGGDVLVPGLWSIDLATGDRALFAVFEGTDRFPRGTVFDAAADRIYVVTSARVFVVDAATGVPTLVSDAATGTGPAFTLLHAIALDAANSRVFVFDDPGTVLSVDLATGNRAVVSDAAMGSGPAFTPGRGAAMAHDATGNLLIVAAPALPGAGDALVAVSPATGNRTVLSASTLGTGPAFSFAGGVAIAADFALGRVFVAQEGTILEVNLVTGDRTLLNDGPPGRSAIASDIAGSRVLQVRGGELVAIALPGGGETTLSDAGMGVGPLPVEPRGLEFDAVRGLALAAAYGVE
jgi:DNA-binding beta-propeller fold protein YncE